MARGELAPQGDRALDLFRTQQVDMGVLEGGAQDQPAIQRPAADLIQAKNLVLARLFEENADRPQAKVLEELAANLGTTAINLSWANLSGRKLNGLDLPYANLRAAILNGADLNGADLRGADLTEVLARRVRLSGAQLVGADARGAVFPGADLSNVRAQGVDWTDADLTGADISRTLFPGGVFNRTSLARATWRVDELPIFGDITVQGHIITSGGAIDGLIHGNTQA